MFYNLENYFSPVDSSINNQPKEYSENSPRQWTWDKFERKTRQVSSVVKEICPPTLPNIIGLGEVENLYVLELLAQSISSDSVYGIVHKESPDVRGIDVALLYVKSAFKIIDKNFIEVKLPDRGTRDILYVKGIINNDDTLHITVCHMPSKYGGIKKTEELRIRSAKILRNLIDSLRRTTKHLNFIAIGDFNDGPKSVSVLKGLQASNNINGQSTDSIYNMSIVEYNNGYGTSKHKGKWDLVDQIFVSGNLRNSNNSTYCTPSDFRIYNAEHLLEVDEKYGGLKPFRTYIGYKYNGGYSDHLPVVLNLHIRH
jgi:endonuclease/exonuclease/phosphatase family metal-dependent hydrolase